MSHVNQLEKNLIVCSEFNLSFHRPKKDLCSKCEKYDNADDKVPLEEEHFLLHLSRKKQAQDETTADKKRAAKNSDWLVLTADLQSVLSTPCGNVSSLYYSRKLSVYNFTLYNQVTGDGSFMCGMKLKPKEVLMRLALCCFSS